MNIIPELNLNKHPKACKNNSIVYAKNIKLSNDGSCFENENSILENTVINTYITNLGSTFKRILGVIPCNKELILFIGIGTSSSSDIPAYKILRYNEDKNTYNVWGNENYNGGTLIGTFTYNINNELIIAYSEYDADVDVPLKTLNLGEFDTETINKSINTYKTPLCPEVTIPYISELNYINGFALKGWYYFFIRYKIDDIDYTKWYNFAYPIFINSLSKHNIIKYVGLLTSDDKITTTGGAPFSIGCIDYISNNINNSDKTIEFEINNLSNNYNYYQIGFICSNNSSSKAYISFDININNTKFKLDYNSLNEYNNIDIIENYINYYNVKNVINYKNRLYIANYKENNNKNIQELVNNNVTLLLKTKYNGYNDIFNNSNEEGDLEYSALSTNITINQNANLYINLTGTEQTYVSYINSLYEENINNILNNSILPYIKGKDDNNNDVIIYANYKKSIQKASYTSPKHIIYFNISNEEFHYTIEYTSSLRRYTAAIIQNPFTTSKQFTNIPTGDKFININNSFNDRIKNNTLIPGEIYNFFIHFVDKYGNETDGYKLKPSNYILNLPLNGGSIIQLSNYIIIKGNDTYYAVVNINNLIFINNDINIESTKYYTRGNSGFINVPETSEIKEIFINKFNAYKNFNLTWAYVDTYVDYNYNGTVNYQFIPIKNSKNELLFKIPNYNLKYSDNLLNAITFNFDVIINSNNFINDYVGYFISYEKFEKSIKYTGIICKEDINIGYDVSNSLIDYNNKKTNKIQFYSSELDINDKIDTSFNVINVLNKNIFDTSEIQKSPLSDNYINGYSNKYIGNLNIVGNILVTYNNDDHREINKYYEINYKELCIGGDANNGRNNLGTSIKLNYINELFDDDTSSTSEIINHNNNFLVQLINKTNNIYLNNNKILIRCSNTIKLNSGNQTNNIYNSNGFITYNNFLLYNANGVVLSDTTKKLSSNDGKLYYKNKSESSNPQYYYKPIHYIQFPQYCDRLLECKSFKNEPANKSFLIESISDQEDTLAKTTTGCFVEAKDSIDLFEDKYKSQDDFNPYTRTNYIESNNFIDTFTKTVRRSAIISDESSENNWRKFPLEEYKQIAENKGIINNIAGIGNTLLIHTEHSMFAFNNDSRLKNTEGGYIQITTPDIFDVDYKEVFTSDLGTCGLQDKKSFIVNEFGYYFYNTDAHRFYKFGQQKIDIIGEEINEFLDKYKIDTVRFCFDKFNNRFLIACNGLYNLPKTILSYNYLVNKFISTHDYSFDEGFATKNNTYMIYNNKLYNINKDNIVYNMFNNSSNPTEIKSSRIDIICNTEYEVIKSLEYIIYKLYKINTNPVISDISSSRELTIRPYSGELLKVYNDIVSTGDIDIKVASENLNNTFIEENISKPYYELGNWNFNYLKDINNPDEQSRIYGNYFIISLTMNGNEEDIPRKLELEDINYRLIKYR